VNIYIYICVCVCVCILMSSSSYFPPPPPPTTTPSFPTSSARLLSITSPVIFLQSFSSPAYVQRCLILTNLATFLLHFVFPSIPQLSSWHSSSKTSFQNFRFCYRTSLLHAQPTVIFQHAHTLTGQRTPTLRNLVQTYHR